MKQICLHSVPKPDQIFSDQCLLSTYTFTEKSGARRWLQFVSTFLLLISNLLRERERERERAKKDIVIRNYILFAIILKPIRNFKKIKIQFCNIFNFLQNCVYNNLPYCRSRYFSQFKCVFTLYCFLTFLYKHLNIHFIGFGLTSELETLKIATDSTGSQILTFVFDAQIINN